MHWLSVNLPIFLLSVLSLVDAKPNTLVDYVKRTGAALARNKSSDGKVSTRQLTSWRLWLMWLCWCDSVDWGYWLTMVKALYWQMKELLKHALWRLTRKSALDIERKKKKPSQYDLSLYLSHSILLCTVLRLIITIFLQSYSIGDINSNVNILEEINMQMDIKWH